MTPLSDLPLSPLKGWERTRITQWICFQAWTCQILLQPTLCWPERSQKAGLEGCSSSVFNKHLTLCVLSCFSHVQLCAIPWAVARRAPLSLGFSRQEYRSGLPCPPPRDLPDPGIEAASLCLPHWQAGCLPLVSPGKSYSVQFSCSVVSDSLRPNESQHALSQILPESHSFCVPFCSLPHKRGL